MDALRVPVSILHRRGIPAVLEIAGDRSVVVTSGAQTIAVIEPGARADDVARLLTEASLKVLGSAAEVVVDRSHTVDLDEACERLGIDVEVVRRRAGADSPG